MGSPTIFHENIFGSFLFSHIGSFISYFSVSNRGLNLISVLWCGSRSNFFLKQIFVRDTGNEINCSKIYFLGNQTTFPEVSTARL